MEVEHIDPHGGDVSNHLCLSCGNCNRSKGIVKSGIDPKMGVKVPLFNPRRQRCPEYFARIENGTVIAGITDVGRATINRLKMNPDIVRVTRARWIIAGYHPPEDTR